MSKPGEDASTAGKPQLYDTAPPRWTGVPVERDPVSGTLFSGDPLGRQDKGRTSSRTPGKTALITAGAVAVVAAVVVAVVFVAGDDDPDPDPTAAGQTSTEPTTSSASTTTTPAVETGPREVTVTLTTTTVTPPPGYPQDPAQGSVGDVLTFTWRLTGPCDGAGACQLEQCDAGQCGSFEPIQPQGAGYVSRFSNPVVWGDPVCSGGTTDNTVTWVVAGQGDETTVTGSWVQTAEEVLLPSSDGGQCALYLREWSISSP